jgi:hypothetical protein
VNLLQALRGGPPGGEQRYSIEDYAMWVAEAGPAGMGTGVTQTLSGARERAAGDYVGLVQTAYAANGVVFACMLARQLVFSAVRFQWQRLAQGRPSELFGTAALQLLETPWPGGTTQDLLNRMIQDADLAGNSYQVVDTPLARLGGDGGQQLVRLRPDWVEVVLEPRIINRGQVGWRKLGYVYTEGGPGADADLVPFLAGEVAHFAPIPDPLASYRGMSWLTPVIREVQADRLMTTHKRRFFENGATPNMIIKHPPERKMEQVKEFKALMDAEHRGAGNAYKVLHLGGGADATVVGSDFQAMSFRDVQGAGETRIAAAARVSPVIVGLSEGLQGSALNAGNYGQARRNFADGTMHPLWQNGAGSLAPVITPRPSLADGRPDPGVRLWYDARDVPFLREDEKDAAAIQSMRAQTLRTWIDGGYTPESAQRALLAGDEGLLVHSGWFSVQLQPPNSGTPAITGGAAGDGNDDE